VEKSAQAGEDHSTLGFVFREDDADAQSTTTLPLVSELEPSPPGLVPDSRRRAVLSLLAAAVALLAIAIAGYLWYVAHGWQDKASALRAEATAARNEIAVVRGERDAARTELNQRTVELQEARTQLDQVNQRINELTNERGRRGTDQREVTQELTKQAEAVANELQKCTDAHDGLIQRLTSDEAGVDASQVIMNAQEVQAACAAARSSYEELEDLVSRLRS
jgi:uncharacterized protein (DUF3084 family)